MKRALISDIHGNIEALTAVLADIDSQNVTDILCQGDVIGYGGNPCECVDTVEKRCSMWLKGNHDDAGSGGPTPFWGSAPKAAIEWTMKQLGDARIARIKDLPRMHEEGDFIYVHGAPGPDEWFWTHTYIMERNFFGGQEAKETETAFEHTKMYATCGHSHMPGRATRQGKLQFTWEAQRTFGENFHDIGDGPAILNIGSVGQPRDEDPRACYLILDTANNQFQYRRVDYDIAAAQASIRKLKLPNDFQNRLADRLATGN